MNFWPWVVSQFHADFVLMLKVNYKLSTIHDDLLLKTAIFDILGLIEMISDFQLLTKGVNTIIIEPASN